MNTQQSKKIEMEYWIFYWQKNVLDMDCYTFMEKITEFVEAEILRADIRKLLRL